MFSSKIYGSWREIQFEKFEAIFEAIEELDVELGLTLDLGAANGFLKEFMVARGIEAEVVALDIDGDTLKLNPSEHLIVADGNALPFGCEVFDSLFCIDVAHLLERLDISCVKDGGLVVLALPYRHAEKFEKIKGQLDAEIAVEFVINGREKEIVAIMFKVPQVSRRGASGTLPPSSRDFRSS
ncbi:MAG: class I SAM-dependent methyltransferase [Archaeoglobaceae archaeon]